MENSFNSRLAPILLVFFIGAMFAQCVVASADDKIRISRSLTRAALFRLQALPSREAFLKKSTSM
jgi:hypothetical protein